MSDAPNDKPREKPFTIWRRDGHVLITVSDDFGGGGIEFDDEAALALAQELAAMLSPQARGARRPWTADDDAKFTRLYESGMSARRIAEEMGRGLPAVGKRLGQLGIANRRPDQRERLAVMRANRKRAA